MKKLLTILSFIGLMSTGFAVEKTKKADLPDGVVLVADSNIVPTNLNNLNITNLTKEGHNVKFAVGNFFPITSVFSEKLLADFSEHLMNYDGDEMLIYFDSPGGSVFAMARMIGLMNSSKIKFKCVARFAASAAFNMFEACDTRLLLPDGILMSHEWSGGFRGEAPRILSLFKAIDGLVKHIEVQTVAKLNIEMKEYKALINQNLWMTAELGIKYNAIDGLVNNVSCSRKLTKQRVIKTVQFYSFRGPINSTVIKNGCPLISKTYKKKNSEEYYGYSDLPKFDYTFDAQLRDRLGTHQITHQLHKSINVPKSRTK